MIMNKKILTIFGTRPEIIKLAPLIKKMKEDSHFQNFTCNTGQHREMADEFLDIFDIEPDYDLKVMEESQTLNEVTTRILSKIEKVIKQVEPDLILVQGDTTTAFVGALAGYYAKRRVIHVEAGLRSHCKYNPFPEEKNRELIDHLADFYFCPTEENKANLINEDIDPEKVFVTGNTIVDSLNRLLKNKKISKQELFEKTGLDIKADKFILVTSHRRESFGEDLKNIFEALKKIVNKNDIEIIYPVHLNPNVRKPAFEILGNKSQIHLINPLDYVDFINLLSYSYFAVTDSGGVIEEAPSLNKPVLIIRKETERQELINRGGAKLIGVEKKDIINKTEDLIENKELYRKMAEAENPFGDGKASQRIIKHLKEKI